VEIAHTGVGAKVARVSDGPEVSCDDRGMGFTHAGYGTEVARAYGGWEITRASGGDRGGGADACVRDTGRRQDVRGGYGDAGADGLEGSG
jgi:hypothetical protein